MVVYGGGHANQEHAVTIPTRAEAQAILEPYHAMIHQVVTDGWDEWRTTHRLRAESGMPSLMYRRTIVNIVFDAIARHALTTFGSHPLVAVKDEAQTIKLIFRGKILLRFKKAGDDKLGHNVPTQAALAFADADTELPGFPPETAKVEVVWKANELWTQVEQVLVVARDGNHLIWEYEIDKGQKGGTVFPLLPHGNDPSDGSDEGMVKVKPIPAQKSAKK